MTIRGLHVLLVKKIPTLSKTTLYNTLELFAAKGLVRALTIDPGEARYDGVIAPHHHFFCSGCGRILDLEISCPTGRAGELHGHRIDEVHGYFKGVCRDCLSESRPDRPPRIAKTTFHPKKESPPCLRPPNVSRSSVARSAATSSKSSPPAAASSSAAASRWSS